MTGEEGGNSLLAGLSPYGELGGRFVSEDLRRAFALIATGDMGGARTEASRFGLEVQPERRLALLVDRWELQGG